MEAESRSGRRQGLDGLKEIDFPHLYFFSQRGEVREAPNRACGKRALSNKAGAPGGRVLPSWRDLRVRPEVWALLIIAAGGHARF